MGRSQVWESGASFFILTDLSTSQPCLPTSYTALEALQWPEDEMLFMSQSPLFSFPLESYSWFFKVTFPLP